MGALILLGFAILSSVSLFLPFVCFDALIMFFPLQQVVWSSSDALRTSVSAMRTVNYVVGMVALLSAVLALARNPNS